MTKGIRIICKTELGEKAVKQHLKEKKIANRMDRMMYARIIEEHIIAGPPMIFELRMRSNRLASMLRFDHLRQEIVSTMSENGAVIEEDYVIEEIKE